MSKKKYLMKNWIIFRSKTLIKKNMEEKIIMVGLAILLGIGLIVLIEKKSKELTIKEKNSISYMEQAGIGVVLGKSLVGENEDKEIAIQFKDTILYSRNKEWYYLLKEGDSIQVKEGQIIKRSTNGSRK